MPVKHLLTALCILFSVISSAQDHFNYEIVLEEVTVPKLPGLHSYAFAQHDNKWLLIGGRKDGLHARQPFNTFPEAYSNTTLYVVDLANKTFWSASNSSLDTDLQEQLRSTNMNFHQLDDTLYIIGGYGYSAAVGEHITFPKATAIQVDSLMEAIINATSISPYIKQISSDRFAVTGGQMGVMDDEVLLVGGHRFDGRYNPMGHNTYDQVYTEEVRKFRFKFTGSDLHLLSYDSITDALHLHRRDYNLIPQVFPNGQAGYTISSGVFQEQVDLPFLYPVDIYPDSVVPRTSFNQYLSNYHSAKVSLYDSTYGEMHSIFFGGMSQYYYDAGVLKQDNGVPFVKTISRLTRASDGSLHEYKMDGEMPLLQGASAEFILNQHIPLLHNEIVNITGLKQDSLLLGYILGGIYSPSLNPFASNQTSTTSADSTLFAVKLVKSPTAKIHAINGEHSFKMTLTPNPAHNFIDVKLSGGNVHFLHCVITDVNGKLIQDMALDPMNPRIFLKEGLAQQMIYVSLVVDHKYFISKVHMLR